MEGRGVGSTRESRWNFRGSSRVQEALNQRFGENVIDHGGRWSDGLIGGGAALEKGKGCELSVAFVLEDFMIRWGVVVAVPFDLVHNPTSAPANSERLDTYRCGRPHGEMSMAQRDVLFVLWRHPTIIATVIRVTCPFRSENGNLLIDCSIDGRDIVLGRNLTKSYMSV
jgi:hypothetical protein